MEDVELGDASARDGFRSQINTAVQNNVTLDTFIQRQLLNFIRVQLIIPK